MSSIIINGKSYNGNNITIKNGDIIIDGNNIEIDSKNINIIVNGDIDKLDITSCNSLEIKGDVNSIKTTSGDINCGNIKGDVNTISGDIKVDGNIYGNTKTVSGDIKYKKVENKDIKR